jgi:hypothetical protein
MTGVAIAISSVAEPRSRVARRAHDTGRRLLDEDDEKDGDDGTGRLIA